MDDKDRAKKSWVLATLSANLCKVLADLSYNESKVGSGEDLSRSPGSSQIGNLHSMNGL